MRKVIIAMSILCYSTLAYASDLTGMEALRGAKNVVAMTEKKDLSPEDMVDASYWLGYFGGINDAVIATCAIFEKEPLYSIPPEGIQAEQIALIVDKYLSENPEKLHLPARACVIVALGLAFPRKEGVLGPSQQGRPRI